MGVCKRRDKVARSVIANDRDAAMSGRWDGPELTGQIDPSRTFRPSWRRWLTFRSRGLLAAAAHLSGL
jgi:hypothetical protein